MNGLDLTFLTRVEAAGVVWNPPLGGLRALTA